MKPLLVCIGTGSLLLNLRSGTAEAQGLRPLSAAAPANRGRNIVRIDWLAPIKSNFSYNFWYNRGLLLPLMASYERLVADHWSVGGEVLVNGGYPDEERKGVGLSTRYYFSRAALPAPLSGVYVSPVASYLSLRVRDASYPVDTEARRLRLGAMVGWQGGLLKSSAPRLITDWAVGVMNWSELGSDKEKYPLSRGFEGNALKSGIKVDVRAGIGCQF